MRQFVLPASYRGEDSITLRGKSFHYLAHVLRLKEGAVFPGMGVAGERFALTLVFLGETSCTLAIKRTEERGGEAVVASTPRLTLYQCLCKGNAMDLIVRQAAECGIHRIVPVQSVHSLPETRGRADRWERVIREALQQSGTRRVPLLAPALPLKEIPNDLHGRGIGLFFHQAPLANKTLHEYLSTYSEEIALVIGPEGGLSEAEVALLAEAGLGAVYLGASVLRVETAALSAIADRAASRVI